MADPRFFRVAGPLTVADLAALTGAEIAGAGNRELVLRDVAPLETAGASDVSFLSNPRYVATLGGSAAGAVFLHPRMAARARAGATLLVTPDPYLAFARAGQAFYPLAQSDGKIASTAVIDPSATLGEGVEIGHHVVIERDVEIGAGTVISPNSVIAAGVIIGADCRIGANVTISHAILRDRITLAPGVRVGQDGFGFAPNPPHGHVRIRQLGRVIIESDVEIGANSTIDRGAGPDTVIGAGSMIDNLVQIGHNGVMGRGCVMVAQSGISGSTKLGNFVMIGGQVGVAGHLTVGDGAQIAGGAGVMRHVGAGEKVGGLPAVPMVQWHRQTTILDRLARKKDT